MATTMRLWHQNLISKLPRQQLLGQHRECCALRGMGWLKPHSVINYIFGYDIKRLESYHRLVMNEMQSRGYNVSVEWEFSNYRGKKLPTVVGSKIETPVGIVYPEHDDNYYRECIDNLYQKGIVLG